MQDTGCKPVTKCVSKPPACELSSWSFGPSGVDVPTTSWSGSNAPTLRYLASLYGRRHADHSNRRRRSAPGLRSRIELKAPTGAPRRRSRVHPAVVAGCNRRPGDQLLRTDYGSLWRLTTPRRCTHTELTGWTRDHSNRRRRPAPRLLEIEGPDRAEEALPAVGSNRPGDQLLQPITGRCRRSTTLEEMRPRGTNFQRARRPPTTRSTCIVERMFQRPSHCEEPLQTVT